jgi:glycerophosphoryl diester phosphodiesterase
VLVIGHRGGRGGGWPTENTLEAFDKARCEGAAAIELDVRLSADHEPVCVHDEDLARITGGVDRRPVASVPFAELARVRLDAGGSIAPLGAVVAWAERHGVLLHVELKRDVPDRALLARTCARMLRGARTEVVLSSFDPGLLVWFARIAPHVPRAILTHTGERGARVLHALAMRPLVSAVHLERTQVEPRTVARLHGRGLAVRAYTVNDPTEARALVRLGVDGIITDDPSGIAAAIAGVASARPTTR